MSKHHQRIIIIGAGPAGIAAAIQLRRYGINALLFEQGLYDDNGSLLRNAWRVENYLGFPQGISGIELLQLFCAQLRANDITPIGEQVTELDYSESGKCFTVKTVANTYYAEQAIVASGTVPKLCLPIATQDNFLPLGKISYEVFPFLTVKKQRFAIIGAGDAAFDYALNLLERDSGNTVTIFNHTTAIKALALLQDIAFNQQRFGYYSNAQLVNITATSSSALILSFAQKQAPPLVYECDYLIVAIGRAPRKDFYSANLRQHEAALIKSGLLKLAGDVKGDIYRQTAIAVADGIRAAMT